MKILDGKELAGFIKERQAREVARMVSEGARRPRLVIIRDNDSPVIETYVRMKRRYGEDIGVEVEDWLVGSEGLVEVESLTKAGSLVEVEGLTEAESLMEAVAKGAADAGVDGMIVQLPLKADAAVDLEKLLAGIPAEKDVDGLRGVGDAGSGLSGFDGAVGFDGANGVGGSDGPGAARRFESATATAINWLLAGYGVELAGKRIALVGRGRLVGAPLYRMWKGSGYEVEMFHRGSDLTKLAEFDIIISATGVPGLIVDAMVKPGAVVVDAGTASEGGVLKGDVAEEVRERTDLAAITPVKGGVGPLTVACLFEHVIVAAQSN